MATAKATEGTKKYKALGNILGAPVEGNVDAATKKLTPHKLHRKGSFIDLNEKDAAALLKLGVVEPVK